MTITFYTISEENEEIEVKSWNEATHCIIDCDYDGDLFKAGMWVERHKRTIADFTAYDTCLDNPYVEVYKKRA